jgi:hypothetical protein
MLALQKDPRSHLAQTYHSMTPYRLGPHVVKLRARPLHDVTARPSEEFDSLRAAVAAQLAAGDARFAIEVQRRTSDDLLVEDARQKWPEDKAPFAQVAELAIPSQTFDGAAQLAWGDNLSFSPWHGLRAPPARQLEPHAARGVPGVVGEAAHAQREDRARADRRRDVLARSSSRGTTAAARRAPCRGGTPCARPRGT